MNQIAERRDHDRHVAEVDALCARYQLVEALYARGDGEEVEVADIGSEREAPTGEQCACIHHEGHVVIDVAKPCVESRQHLTEAFEIRRLA